MAIGQRGLTADRAVLQRHHEQGGQLRGPIHFGHSRKRRCGGQPWRVWLRNAADKPRGPDHHGGEPGRWHGDEPISERVQGWALAVLRGLPGAAIWKRRCGIRLDHLQQPARPRSLGGTLYWFRPAGKTPAVYQSGFTNLGVSVIGSAYNPTDKPLLALTNGQVTLDGGNLPFAITNQITLSANDTITGRPSAENTNKLALTINKSHRRHQRQFCQPLQPKAEHQSQRRRCYRIGPTPPGYFLGTNQSGAFLLEKP